MRLGVPELVGHYVWQGLDLLVTAPLPHRVRRLGLRADLPEASLLREISQISGCYVSELGVSRWWRALRTRIGDGVADNPARAQLELIADGIERRYGHMMLEFGSWHGDFVPWNLARLGERVYAWDWESSGPDTPVGFDALHYHFQLAFVARRRPLAEAARRASHRAGPALEALGIRPDRCELVAALHLMELFARHEEARSSAGGGGSPFLPGGGPVARAVARWPAGHRQPGRCGACRMKVMLVCSAGGHLTQLYRLRPWWQRHERTWVTCPGPQAESLLAAENWASGSLRLPATSSTPSGTSAWPPA